MARLTGWYMNTPVPQQEMHQYWLRGKITGNPNQKIQLIGGAAIDVLSLSTHESYAGISLFDIRRLFYFQVKINLIEDGEAQQKYILVARYEITRLLPNFNASFFCGVFRVDYVSGRFDSAYKQVFPLAEKLLNKGESVKLRRLISNSYKGICQKIPHHKVQQVPKELRSHVVWSLIRAFISKNWEEWISTDTESKWESKRFSPKKCRKDALPRAITVIRTRYTHEIRRVYIHLNRNGEGLVGQGGFNRVKLLFDMISGTWATIRQTHGSDIDSCNKIARKDYNIKSTLAHEYIEKPSFLGVHTKKDGSTRVWTIQPLARGSLADISPRNSWERLNWAKQIIAGVRALHRQGVVHLDIKQDNILVSPERDILLSDFGCAISEKYKTPSGASLLSLCPFKTKFTNTNDIWAVGIVLWRLLEVKMFSTTLKREMTFVEFFRKFSSPITQVCLQASFMRRVHQMGDREEFPFRSVETNPVSLFGEWFLYCDFKDPREEKRPKKETHEGVFLSLPTHYIDMLGIENRVKATSREEVVYDLLTWCDHYTSSRRMSIWGSVIEEVSQLDQAYTDIRSL